MPRLVAAITKNSCCLFLHFLLLSWWAGWFPGECDIGHGFGNGLLKGKERPRHSTGRFTTKFKSFGLIVFEISGASTVQFLTLTTSTLYLSGCLRRRVAIPQGSDSMFRDCGRFSLGSLFLLFFYFCFQQRIGSIGSCCHIISPSYSQPSLRCILVAMDWVLTALVARLLFHRDFICMYFLMFGSRSLGFGGGPGPTPKKARGGLGGFMRSFFFPPYLHSRN